jgi:TetR/AcrR family transcriptional regulator, mexJK operon transcriptional repressor
METTLETPAAEVPALGKSERRRQAILDVARELFQAQGYAATSMSEIAARLGGSKGTLYNYFRSKEELFAAFMIDTCQIGSNAVFDPLEPAGADLREALVDLGVNFLTFLLMPDTLAVHRLVVAECGRFPELGRIFYETGPKRGQENLARFFASIIADGRLKPGDPMEIGHWYKDILLGDVYNRTLWGVLGPLTPEQLRAHVGRAVEVFLRAFG